MSFWDEAAETLDGARAAVLGAADWSVETDRHVSRICASLHPMPAGPLIDFGCGIGRLTVPVARRTGRAVLGYDSSEAMLRWAPEHERVRYGSTLPSDLGAYAGAFTMQTFQHMPDMDVFDALRNLWARCKPGASLVVQFATGTTQELLCWERDPATMRNLVVVAGWHLLGEGPDTVNPTWWWQRARKP